MNPIHESGFASLVVLFFAACPSGLAALIAIICSWKHPKLAISAANVALVIAALVCILAAVTTLKLHSRVDYWIDTGGYGPAAEIRAKYGEDWHASARLTAWAGLVFCALPSGISVIVHALVRRKVQDIKKPIGPLVALGVAAFFCFIMAVF